MTFPTTLLACVAQTYVIYSNSEKYESISPMNKAR